MSISMAVFTFINSWWIALFFVWPFAINPAEKGSGIAYAAAPRVIQWKKLLLVDTVAALLITAVLALLMHYGVMDLRHMQ